MILFGILQLANNFLLLLPLSFFRCIISTDSQPDSEILCPVSLTLLVQRNLAAAWYHKSPTIGIKGDLKPMQVISWLIRAILNVTHILRVVLILVKELVNAFQFVSFTACWKTSSLIVQFVDLLEFWCCIMNSFGVAGVFFWRSVGAIHWLNSQ